MSFRPSFKTKYTTIQVNEDHDGAKPFYWASVALAWTEAAPPREKLFAVTMDDRLLSLIRNHMAKAVENPEKDIYLEDVDVLINLKASEKHQAAKLIGIVEKVEAEFDALAAEAK